MQKLLDWVSNKLLPIGTLFLLFFIPVYPKLPLIHVIRTWVYIRFEDVLVAVVVGLFVITQIRERNVLRSPLAWPIVVYWGVGIIVLLSSIVFIGPHLVGYFPHLVFLHYLRRIEYMMLFFVAFVTAMKHKWMLKAVIWTFALTILTVIVYGVGQKFFGFPAFLTMNEEFAKGVPLRLPPTARIASTFGGHYDLAAFLVLAIPILGSLVFAVSRIWQKLLFLVLAVGSLVMLLFTASRISFGVYLVAITVMLIWQKKKLFIIPVIILSMILLNFVSGASDRFYKTFRFSNVIIDLSTGQPIGTLDKLEGTSAIVENSQSPAKENLPAGSGYIGIPTYTPPKPTKVIKTVETYSSLDLATGSGEIATVSGSFLIQKALVYDISITTRFQGQWPKAMEAFKRNILLGSGYSTLSLAADGDYLRMLGETGIIGSISFLGVFLAAFRLFIRRRKTLDPLAFAFVTGVFAGIVGLFLNAILIDVFEASKVAFTLWILLGIAIASLSVNRESLSSYIQLLRKVLTHRVAYMLYLAIIVFTVYLSALPLYFLGDDFTWLRWAAQSQSGDIVKFFADSRGFFYRPIPKLWYMALYAIFWLKPTAYHVFSLGLFSTITIALYGILLKLRVRHLIALFIAVLYALLSIHHENIFWISGQSSLLGSMFVLVGLWILLSVEKDSKRWILILKFILGYLAVFGAMLSYDGLIMAPIIVVAVLWLIGGKKYTTTLLPLLLIPLYWWMRSSANAVNPSGDYGYKTSTILVNSIGNAVGYFIATFLGPITIEQFAKWREIVKAERLIFEIAVGAVCLAGAVTARIVRRPIKQYKSALVWFGCFMISLVPYVGLGGMAERYDLLPSAFLLMAAASFLEVVWQKYGSMALKVVSVMVIAGLIYWNMSELNRISRDWAKASDIAQKSLLMIKTQFFPLNASRSFVYINTPIRYGRAWIFSVGLEDAMWHMFKFNQYPYEVLSASSIKQGFDVPVKYMAREVLVFDNYKLKRAQKEITTYEVPVEASAE